LLLDVLRLDAESLTNGFECRRLLLGEPLAALFAPLHVLDGVGHVQALGTQSIEQALHVCKRAVQQVVWAQFVRQWLVQVLEVGRPILHVDVDLDVQAGNVLGVDRGHFPGGRLASDLLAHDGDLHAGGRLLQQPAIPGQRLRLGGRQRFFFDADEDREELVLDVLHSGIVPLAEQRVHFGQFRDEGLDHGRHFRLLVLRFLRACFEHGDGVHIVFDDFFSIHTFIPNDSVSSNLSGARHGCKTWDLLWPMARSGSTETVTVWNGFYKSASICVLL